MVLKKVNIPVDEKFVGGEIIQLVSFLPTRIPQKNAFLGTSIKFGCGMIIGGKSKTPKDSHMFIGRWFAI